MSLIIIELFRKKTELIPQSKKSTKQINQTERPKLQPRDPSQSTAAPVNMKKIQVRKNTRSIMST